MNRQELLDSFELDDETTVNYKIELISAAEYRATAVGAGAVPMDTAAFLESGDGRTRRVRGGRGADAAGGGR